MSSFSVIAGCCFAITACTTHDDTRGGDASDEGMPLSAITAFGHDNYPSQAECDAAKMRGDIPPQATCQNQLLFCPSGAMHEYTGDVVSTGMYTTLDGTFAIDIDGSHVTGMLATDGTLSTVPDGQTYATVWKPIDAALVTIISCN